MKCDVNTGVCSFDPSDFEPIIDQEVDDKYEMNKDGKIDVFLFTDVLCSYCWEAEPEINRFLFEYSDQINFYTIMGAMVKEWKLSETGDMKNELNMQHLWQEVASTYRMPSDGSAWIRETPSSSYPASIVFNILRRRSHEIAEMFLRRAKELTFIQNRDAGQFSNLETVLEDVLKSYEREHNTHAPFGVDEILTLAQAEDANKYLNSDFELMDRFHVEVFPSIVLVAPNKDSLLLKGKNSYEHYDYAIKELSDSVIKPKDIPALNDALGYGNYLFSREIEELYGLKPEEVKTFVQAHLTSEEYEFQTIAGEFAIVNKNTPQITL